MRPFMRNLIACFAASCGLLMAPNVAGAAAYTTPGQITHLETDGGTTTLYVPDANNPMGCSNGTVLRINTTDGNYQAILAILLTSYSLQKAVALFAVACLSDGTVHFASVYITN